MKKLIALMFCVAVLTTAAHAEYPGAKYPQQKEMKNRLEEKVNSALKVVDFQKMKVLVTLIAQTPYDNRRNLKNIYKCEGFLINKNGDVAIHKGCAEALNLAQHEGTGHVALHVDMHNLGSYKVNGDPFYYEASSVEPALFADRPDYLLFAVPLNPNSEVKEALQKQFGDNQPGFTKEKVSALVKTLPAVKKVKEL